MAPLKRGIMGFFDIFGQKRHAINTLDTSMSVQEPVPVAPVSDIAPIHAEELPPMPTPPSEDIKSPPEETQLPEMHFDPSFTYATQEIPPDLPKEETSTEPPRQVHLSTSTLFISVSDYKAVLGKMNLMRTKITDMEHYLARLNAIKNDKDHHLERWCASLEDVEKKLGYADQIIARADG